MVFSDTTNKNGIIQTCEFYCGLGDAGISGNATLLKQFTNLVNIANSRVWHLLFKNNGGWKYDDSNNTDLPQASQDLSNGVSKYALPTGALQVDRVEVKDVNGDYQKLAPLTLEQITEGLDEFQSTDGLPRYYRLVGSTIELFPGVLSTAVTTTNGLKVYFGRGSTTFASTDTTKTPGFASEYHDMVPVKSSLEWLKVNKPNSGTLTLLMNDDVKRESQLVEYEVNKFKDRKPARFQPKYRNYE